LGDAGPAGEWQGLSVTPCLQRRYYLRIAPGRCGARRAGHLHPVPLPVKSKQTAQLTYALGMIGLGVVGLGYGDFMSEWKFASDLIPGRHELAYASAVIMLLCGIGLLAKGTELIAARVLLPYWAILVLILKIPTIVKSPLVEVAWESLSELLVLMTAAWVLATADKRAQRAAQLLFGAALIPFGLSHFFYLKMTAPLIPRWIPHHTALAYLTGAAHLAAGFGVLFGVYARLAASMEALMLALFAALVWIPQVIAKPTQDVWSELAASFAMSAGAWVVAASIAKRKAP
jgi:uncharacterized membrane protein